MQKEMKTTWASEEKAQQLYQKQRGGLRRQTILRRKVARVTKSERATGSKVAKVARVTKSEMASGSKVAKVARVTKSERATLEEHQEQKKADLDAEAPLARAAEAPLARCKACRARSAEAPLARCKAGRAPPQARVAGPAAHGEDVSSRRSGRRRRRRPRVELRPAVRRRRLCLASQSRGEHQDGRHGHV